MKTRIFGEKKSNLEALEGGQKFLHGSCFLAGQDRLGVKQVDRGNGFRPDQGLGRRGVVGVVVEQNFESVKPGLGVGRRESDVERTPQRVLHDVEGDTRRKRIQFRLLFK